MSRVNRGKLGLKTLTVPVSGVVINGTAVTATGAELNKLTGVVGGTAAASKAVVLGANKNLDTLAIADGGLKLGADAGTAVTATAEEINDATLPLDADGLGRMGVARFTFDPTGDEASRTIAAHGTGVTLPANAVVIGGFYEVNTAFTSEGGNAGTVAISINAGNDLVTATAVSNAIYGTTGLKAITPKSNTPEGTGIKLAAAKEITCTVAGQALTAGKLTGFLHYVVSAATA